MILIQNHNGEPAHNSDAVQSDPLNSSENTRRFSDEVGGVTNETVDSTLIMVSKCSDELSKND